MKRTGKAAEIEKYGQNVMLAYGGGSVKKNGIYDEIRTLLEQAGKNVIDFSDVMSNPTYAKVQEGAALVRKEHIDFILAVGGGSVIDCCKVISAQAVLDPQYTMSVPPMQVLSGAFDTLSHALEAFVKECNLPSRLSELKSRVEITPEILRKVADTSNIIKCNPRELTADEIYEILMECK